tara:strand:+ start:311 stop:1063 length:753 start_codon:yes stop_codon:yes gene_type:complete
MYTDSEFIATQLVLENLPIVKSLRKKLKKKEKENKKLIKILERLTRNEEYEEDCCNIEDVKIKLEPTDEELKVEDLSTTDVEIVKPPINKENIVYEIQDYTGKEVPKYKDEKEPDWDYKQIEKSMIKNVATFSEKNADEVCSELSTDAVSEVGVEESEEEEEDGDSPGEEEEEVEEEVEDEEEEEEEEEVEEEDEEEEEEEEEEEVFEVKIKGKKYYTSNEKNGPIYEITEDEDVGDEVGKFVNGKATFK